MSFAYRWPGNYSQSGCGVSGVFSKYTIDQAKLLKPGSSQAACIRTLQNGLKNAGFMSKSLATDGKYGTNTKNSVILMQSYYNMRTKDGLVGKCSWFALQGANNYAGMNDQKKVRDYVWLQNKACL